MKSYKTTWKFDSLDQRKQLHPTDFCMYPQKQQEQSKGHNGVFLASDLLIPKFSCVNSKWRSISSFLTAQRLNLKLRNELFKWTTTRKKTNFTV